MNFILDYEALGEQTGHLAMEVLQSGVCQSPDPTFSIWVNREAVQRLDISLGEEVTEEGIITP